MAEQRNPMAQIQTLYDVLKVSREAPSEVIRASYKALSQKHHPDRNLGDARAAATMQEINRAYAILSIPEKRQQYDSWIAQREREHAVRATGQHSQGGPWKQKDEAPRETDGTTSKEGDARTNATMIWRAGAALFRVVLPILVVATMFGFWWQHNHAGSVKSAGSAKSVYCRPVTLNESLQWRSFPAGGLYNCKDSQGQTTYPANPPPGAVVEPRSSDSAVLERIADSVPLPTGNSLPIGECKPVFSYSSNNLENGDPLKGAVYRCRGTDGKITFVTEAEFKRMRDRSAAITLPGNVGAKYQRPAAAENGSPWPKAAAYVDGYRKLNVGGYSKVTVDNAANDSDVFVKLYFLSSSNARPVRHIYVPAHKRFTMNKVDAGSYDVRYKDVNSGAIQKSEMFDLKEVATDGGIQYSEIELTLYKVRNGNMETYVIDESEF